MAHPVFLMHIQSLLSGYAPAGHTVFPRNYKDFSPFALKIMSFFLERMGISVVPWCSMCFSEPFFDLTGTTVSNVLEKIVPCCWSSCLVHVYTEHLRYS